MPDVLRGDAALAALVLSGTALGTLLFHWLAIALLGRFASGSRRAIELVATRCFWSTRLLTMSLALKVALAAVPASPRFEDPAQHALSIVIIAALGWLIVRLTGIAEEVLIERFDVGQRDNRVARRIHTQAIVLQRIVAVVVTVVAAAAILTTFPQVRVMGTSILASAGIAGIVIGFAAQSTLSNLFAGIQIALTDPIRIDDVVVVEGEWGRIEEVTFTYVVVRVWDQRRLILPISYFASRPFQNWTRTDADILGTVFLHLDYHAPLDELRAELQRTVEGSKLWDGRVAGIQVTGTGERTMEVRVLVSAADSPSAWDLRCEVRERLITYLRRHHPETLPRMRAELVGSGSAAAG